MKNVFLFIISCHAFESADATRGGSDGFNRMPGQAYEADWDDFIDQIHDNDGRQAPSAKRPGWMGGGREFSLFDTFNRKPPKAAALPKTRMKYEEPTADKAGGVWSVSVSAEDFELDQPNENIEGQERAVADFSSNVHSYRGGSRGYDDDDDYFTSRRPFGDRRSKPPPRRTPRFVRRAQGWWSQNMSPAFREWPKIAVRVEPTTTLKIRKTLRPLKTIVRVGADYNTQLGVWQFKSSWEDAIIGGKITLAGKELQIAKSWQLSVGAMEDLVTRLRFRAAIDLSTFKAYARVGFRTERLTPINMVDGFTILKRLPLDGAKGHVKLEVKAKLALPEPEIEYSTETQRSMVGMGDIEVNVDELNLVLDY